jgi:hypothetical protein
MVAPPRAYPIEHLSNLAVTAHPCVDRRAEPTLPCLSCIEILQALQDRPSLEIEHTLTTNPQDWTELHYCAGLAHDQESIRSYRLTGNTQGLAEVLVERARTSSTVAPDALDTLVNLQAQYWFKYRISICRAMRPLLMVAGMLNSLKGALP